MISLLNTMNIDTPFDFQKQGNYNEYQNTCPIAHNSNLLPFLSKPFDKLEGATITGWIHCLNGDRVFNLGELFYIEKNDKWSVYHNGSATGANLTLGFYFVQASYNIPPSWAVQTYNDYLIRVEHAGGIVEANECLFDELVKYSGGYNTGGLFKTEVFFVPQPGGIPEPLGDFSATDYNEDFFTG